MLTLSHALHQSVSRTKIRKSFGLCAKSTALKIKNTELPTDCVALETELIWMYALTNTTRQAIQYKCLVKFVAHLDQRNWAIIVRIAWVALLLVECDNSGHVKRRGHRTRDPAVSEQRQEEGKTM